MDPFLGQIIMFGGNFAPRGWALCDGALLSISQFQALFSILGTTYGGNGRTTFALPELRGRVAMHPGSGPGLSNRRLGEKSGTETVTLTQQQMPSHSHGVTVNCSDQAGTADAPTGQVWSGSSEGDQGYTTTPNQTMGAQAAQIGNTGGSQSHNNIQPFQCVNFIIALQGAFPSRN